MWLHTPPPKLCPDQGLHRQISLPPCSPGSWTAKLIDCFLAPLLAAYLFVSWFACLRSSSYSNQAPPPAHWRNLCSRGKSSSILPGMDINISNVCPRRSNLIYPEYMPKRAIYSITIEKDFSLNLRVRILRWFAFWMGALGGKIS